MTARVLPGSNMEFVKLKWGLISIFVATNSCC